MLDAARNVTGIVGERSIEDLDTDVEFKWAIERGLEILGEAAPVPFLRNAARRPRICHGVP